MKRTENGSEVVSMIIFIAATLIFIILFMSVIRGAVAQRDQELHEEKNDKQTNLIEDEENEKYRK